MKPASAAPVLSPFSQCVRSSSPAAGVVSPITNNDFSCKLSERGAHSSGESIETNMRRPTDLRPGLSLLKDPQIKTRINLGPGRAKTRCAAAAARDRRCLWLPTKVPKLSPSTRRVTTAFTLYWFPLQISGGRPAAHYQMKTPFLFQS
jgi:hypothetical protein